MGGCGIHNLTTPTWLVVGDSSSCRNQLGSNKDAWINWISQIQMITYSLWWVLACRLIVVFWFCPESQNNSVVSSFSLPPRRFQYLAGSNPTSLRAAKTLDGVGSLGSEQLWPTTTVDCHLILVSAPRNAFFSVRGQRPHYHPLPPYRLYEFESTSIFWAHHQ